MNNKHLKFSMASSLIASVYKCIPKTEELGKKTTDRFTIFGAAFLGWQAGPFRRSYVLIMTRKRALIAVRLSFPLPSRPTLLASNKFPKT